MKTSFEFEDTSEWESYDPGVKYMAWALWFGSRLAGVGLDPLEWCMATKPTYRPLVVELAHDRKGSAARKQDIDDLIFSTGRLVGTRKFVAYRPDAWKGQVPKSIHQERILEVLTEQELDIVHRYTKSKTKLGHIIDAVGIGLFHSKRLRK